MDKEEFVIMRQKELGGGKLYLAQNLKYLREQKGVSQQNIADVLETNQSAVANWEQNHRKLDIEMIIRLAEYFGVTLDDLVLRDLRPPIPRYSGNIRYLRLSHGITQEDMAKFLCVSKASYCKYENGVVDIGIEKLSKLADFFGVTLDQLVKQDLLKEQ